MIAIVLAAGTGSRLLPITKCIPKTLIPIGGRTLLESIVSNLASVGISEVMIAVGHGKNRVQSEAERLSEDYCINFSAIENDNYGSTNTGFSLLICINHLENEEDVVIVNGDVLFDRRILTRLVSRHKTALVVDEDRELNEESFKVEYRLGRIISMGKGIEAAKANGEFIGVSLVKKKDTKIFTDCLKNIVSANPSEYYDMAFMEMSRHRRIEIVSTNGLRWMEVDTKDDLTRARRLVSNIDIGSAR